MDLGSSPVAIVLFVATVAVSLYTLYRNNMLYFKWLLSPMRVVREKKILFADNVRIPSCGFDAPIV